MGEAIKNVCKNWLVHHNQMKKSTVNPQIRIITNMIGALPKQIWLSMLYCVQGRYVGAPQRGKWENEVLNVFNQ